LETISDYRESDRIQGGDIARVGLMFVDWLDASLVVPSGCQEAVEADAADVMHGVDANEWA
jgi:hypothetical protein